MTTVPISAYLALAVIIFCIGVLGVLLKRNILIVLISIELMLNAVNINFAAFSKYGLTPSINGQVFSLFVIAIAAAEVAVGIAILFAVFRNRATVHLDELNEMKN
jgi:NADH-quinone oxidoreductase subunit K